MCNLSLNVFWTASFSCFLQESISLLPLKSRVLAGCWWLTPVILVIQEVAIRRIEVLNQPGQIIRETLSQKNPPLKRAGGVAQVQTPVSHTHTHTQKAEHLIQMYFVARCTHSFRVLAWQRAENFVSGKVNATQK
jgi:hypothetical protein